MFSSISPAHIKSNKSIQQNVYLCLNYGTIIILISLVLDMPTYAHHDLMLNSIAPKWLSLYSLSQCKVIFYCQL